MKDGPCLTSYFTVSYHGVSLDLELPDYEGSELPVCYIHAFVL